MNVVSGKNIERKICENEIETCEASKSCPENTDDSDVTIDTGSDNNDGGAQVDAEKCWIEYLGNEVRWFHSPPFNSVSAFNVHQDALDYCEETVWPYLIVYDS